MKKKFLKFAYRRAKMHWYRLKYGLKKVHPTFYMAGSSSISSDLIAREHVFIGADCVIYPNVSIGKYTMIAPRVSILGGDHNINNPNKPMIFSGRPKIPKTTIGEDVWIGANVIIKAGITIGNGAVIGSSAVVTKDIPEYSIYAGNPAKLIRIRFNNEEIKLHKKMLLSQNIEPNYTEELKKE